VAASAIEVAPQAQSSTQVASEIAALADRTAEAATRAAQRAREAAVEAAALAESLRDDGVPTTEATAESMHGIATEATAISRPRSTGVARTPFPSLEGRPAPARRQGHR
jgi:hypothetical protein